ncbi:hypothetical protein D3C73_964210 [compost metagenome]
MKTMRLNLRHFLKSIGGNPHESAKYTADRSGDFGLSAGDPVYSAGYCPAQIEGYAVSGAETSEGIAAYTHQGQKMAGAGA